MERTEAIEVIRKNYPHVGSSRTEFETALRELIPELKESEDERIRKELVEFIKWSVDRHFMREDFHQAKRPSEWIAYLERQKEQKPILEVFGFKVGDAVRLKDGDGRKHIIKSFEEVEGIHGPNFFHVEFEDNSARVIIYPDKEYPNGYYTQMEKFEEEQKPFSQEVFDAAKHEALWGEQKPAEWSEEDERNLYNTIEAIKYAYDVSEGSGGWLLINWLKYRLRYQSHWKPSKKQMEALEDAFRKDGGNEYRKVINSLYCDLQKLL